MQRPRPGIPGDGGDRGGSDRLHRQAVPRRGRAGRGEEGARRVKASSHKYLPLFVAEANEQLEALGSDLVRLEKEDPEPALWDSIFRRVHSVKGSAATLGFTGIVDIAHRAEDLVGRMKALAAKPSRGQIDLLFEASDALVKEVRRVPIPAKPLRRRPRWSRASCRRRKRCPIRRRPRPPRASPSSLRRWRWILRSRGSRSPSF
ncbi:MAG: hypothetical protein E6J85_19805 [Deltaproteobacteria bacterium]|nr:MAG: hypothetical protein E6J85_19805 [Deltaproteobacteria bacterium]